MFEVLASEPALLVMALFVIGESALALVFALFYSIPEAVRRTRRYTVPHSAHWWWSRSALLNAVAPVVCVALFLVVGMVLAALPDNAVRAATARLLLLGAITVLSGSIVVQPILNKYTEEASLRERRRMNRKGPPA